MSISKTSGKRIAAAERRAKILALRKKGLPMEEIGKQMGISKQRVNMIIRDCLDKLNTQITKDLTRVVALEEARLDEMFSAVYDKAIVGDSKSVEIALRIMERRSRMRGLDAPEPSKKEDWGRLTDSELLSEAVKFGIQLSPELKKQLEAAPAPTDKRKGQDNERTELSLSGTGV